MQVIGIIGDNSLGFIDSLLDIWNMRACVVLLDWKIPFKQVVEILRDVNADICYIDEVIQRKVINDLPENINFIVYKNNNENYLPENIYLKFNKNYSHKDAIISFSSGTTNSAKGIVLSHYAINKNADAIIDYLKLGDSDVIYIIRSLSYVSTLVGELLVGLKTKTPVYLQSSIISPQKAFKEIERNRATIIHVNPTLLKLYTEYFEKFKTQLTTLKSIYCAGAVLSSSLQLQATKVFKGINIFNVYGLTEAGPRVTAQSLAGPNTLGSAGIPIKGVKVMIVNKKGEILRNNKPGMIHIKTPGLLSKYLNGIKPRKSYYKNWFNTGDFGYYNGNKELFILGRIDEMIISGAHNVYPDNIENIIKSYGDVSDCIVFGVDNEDYGKKIICMYTSKSKRKINEELRKVCSEKMAIFEVPKQFIQVSEIPLTDNGKKSRLLAIKKYSKLYGGKDVACT